MRSARIKEAGACYHIISRIIDRRMLLDDVQKEYFRRNMRAVEDFSGVEILTWAALDNHIHMLVHVPPPQPVSDEELIRRLHLLYEKPVVQSLENHLRDLRAEKQDSAAEEFKKRYTYRMYELSEFVKTLKQRFTQNYNAAHQRRGTLWEGRFKSIVVQGSEYALSAVAAYIDLNAVRAGLVDDPKDYRFCGYGEAVAGCRQARRGISAVMLSLEHGGTWAECAGQYRKLLYMAGEQKGITEEGRPIRPGFDPERVRAVLEEGGALNLQELLRCRVRYFTDGAVLGSKSYVQEVFCRHRGYFGGKRRSGPRAMLGGAWGDLFTARRLRLDVITAPAAS